MIQHTDIKQIMADVWKISADEIPDDPAFNKFLYWDSMGHVALMAALEEIYGMKITYKALTELLSIPIIIAHLKENGHAG